MSHFVQKVLHEQMPDYQPLHRYDIQQDQLRALLNNYKNINKFANSEFRNN
jgi:hypothetical protein